MWWACVHGGEQRGTQKEDGLSKPCVLGGPRLGNALYSAFPNACSSQHSTCMSLTMRSRCDVCQREAPSATMELIQRYAGQPSASPCSAQMLTPTPPSFIFLKPQMGWPSREFPQPISIDTSAVPRCPATVLHCPTTVPRFPAAHFYRHIYCPAMSRTVPRFPAAHSYRHACCPATVPHCPAFSSSPTTTAPSEFQSGPGAHWLPSLIFMSSMRPRSW